MRTLDLWDDTDLPTRPIGECGFVGDTAVNPWVGIFCRRQGFTRESESLMRDSIAWSFIPRGNDSHFTVWQEGDLDYDSEPERTLLRRRTEAKRRARQAVLEQQLNMAAEHHDDNLNLENNQNRVTP
ncbi:hypothetical protein PIB30_054954 [Stylosanthes scabra]|uniref:Uncharacterized protein n=1 Tax=Stylosanthes scabra TaxID=79078 RepID=A0ABU6QJB2_9FABA|nr:hypothetical protein [Stylosanthes scabra]